MIRLTILRHHNSHTSMRSTLVVLTFILSTSLLLASCDKDEPSTSATLSGNIAGHVVFNGFDPSHPLTDYSGTVVTIEGRAENAITDTSGAFTLKGIPAGIYTIVYTHQGYGTYKEIGFQFTGGGTAYVSTKSLTPLPLGTCVLDPIIALDTLLNNTPATMYTFSAYVDRTGLADSLSALNDIILFMSTRSDVSFEAGHYALTQRVWTYSVKTPFGYRKDIQVVYGQDYFSTFHKGDTVNVVAYASNTGIGDYPDPATGDLVYSSLGLKHSQVRSFVLR